MYMMAKHLHMSAVVLSVSLFILRFVYGQISPQFLTKKWVKIVPHIVDSILLASAIWLCILLYQYPITHDWLTGKLLGVVGYIILGTMALKSVTPTKRWAGFVGALVILGITAKIAVTKQLFF